METLFTGDVERVKYKSSLLYFRAEESESGINALRFGAGSARPTGLTPCGVGMSRFTGFVTVRTNLAAETEEN